MRSTLAVILLLMPVLLGAQSGGAGGGSGGGSGSAGGGGTGGGSAGGWVLQSSAAPWSVRVAHTTAAFNNKLWVLGGSSGATSMNDVWSSANGATWTQVSAAAGWSGRIGHASVVFNNKLWVMGGLDAPFSPNNDVWSSADGANWTLETAAAPWSARMNFKALSLGGRMWIFGGYANTDKNDVWSSADGVNWTQETAAAPWMARNNYAAEVFGNLLWVMGGVNTSTTTRLRDVWSSPDGVNWTQATAAAQWSPRMGHGSAVYGGRMWVYGGDDGYYSYNYTPFTNDAWCSPDGINWTRETMSAPWTPRERHGAAYFDNRIWVLGGNAHGGLSNAAWCYGETAPLITSTPGPTAIAGITYIYDLTATGYPQPVFGASGLPGWLTLAGDQLIGAPSITDVGLSGAITVSASNVAGTDTQVFQIDVLGTPPVITSIATTTAVAGTAYSYVVVATGGPPAPSFSASALPGWLTFNAATGELAGTPAGADIGLSAAITITATTGVAPDATQTFQIDVQGQPPQITSMPPADAIVGASWSYTVTATGIPAPIIAASGQPAWVSFNAATGELSGTPGTGDVGTATIQITASNGWGPDATQTFVLDVATNVQGGGSDTGGAGCAGTGGGTVFGLLMLGAVLVLRRRRAS